MYVDTGTILNAGSIITALGAIISLIITVHKFVERDRKQTVIINGMQSELTVIVHGLKGALQGLIEQGCDGPCKSALKELDEHINKKAHQDM